MMMMMKRMGTVLLLELSLMKLVKMMQICGGIDIISICIGRDGGVLTIRLKLVSSGRRTKGKDIFSL